MLYVNYISIKLGKKPNSQANKAPPLSKKLHLKGDCLLLKGETDNKQIRHKKLSLFDDRKK